MKTSWKFDAEIFTNNNPSIFSLLAAQAERVETVYFEFDKYDLDEQQQQNLRFYDKVDTSSIESIQIYGYDDRGTLIIIINYRNKEFLPFKVF
jgi:hypothetical protein